MTQVFECSCCPTNLNRVLASIGDYLYGYENDCVYVNQFADSTAEFSGMKIEKKTEYPKNGKIVFNTENIKKLYVTLPGLCKKYQINRDYYIENGYTVIENLGKDLTVDFCIEPVF